jgi:hypothetical protein
MTAEDYRDPEDCAITDPLARKDKMLDKTIADTFPASIHHRVREGPMDGI